MRRLALIAALGLLLAGCGGGEDTTAEPETVDTVATQTDTGETDTGETETDGTETGGAAVEGDAEAGQEVFAANGCGSCHEFEPAGSSGTTGPNLDELSDLAENANQPVAEFTRQAIAEPSAYVEEGFPDGVMPSYPQLSETQLDDLVAFLTQD